MQQRLKQYLDSLEQPLAKLDPNERQEWRTEAAQHLDSLVQANEELGSTREEALEAAIAQFGDAQAISRRLHQEAARRKIELTPVQAVAGGLFIPMVVSILCLVVMGFPMAAFIRGDLLPPVFLRVLGVILYAASSLISGALLGRAMVRQRIVRRSTGSNSARFFFLLAILLELWLIVMVTGGLGGIALSFPLGGVEFSPMLGLLSPALTFATAGAIFISCKARSYRRRIGIRA